MEVQKPYAILFNAITDALEELERQNFGQAAACLKAAQQQAESVFLEE